MTYNIVCSTSRSASAASVGRAGHVAPHSQCIRFKDKVYTRIRIIMCKVYRLGRTVLRIDEASIQYAQRKRCSHNSCREGSNENVTDTMRVSDSPRVDLFMFPFRYRPCAYKTLQYRNLTAISTCSISVNWFLQIRQFPLYIIFYNIRVYYT